MYLIYLDNAATTQLKPEVLDAMMPYLSYAYGNPGSIHQMGREAAKAVEKAREQVAGFVGAESQDQIIFTSGGSEGNNLVFYGLENELRKRGKNSVAISLIEHDSVWKAAHRLSRKGGFKLNKIAPLESGQIPVSACAEAISDDTGLVSVMMANNETGVRNDVGSICSVAHRNGSLFHTDAVQAAGSVLLNADACGYDFMTISSHKIHGPKGMGALYVRDRSLIEPLICGGAEQEFGLRGGTENVPGIIGFGKACELASLSVKETAATLDRLASEFLRELGSKLPEDRFRINGNRWLTNRKTVNICFPGIDAQTLLIMLSVDGVCVSAGSACRAHENVPSRVLVSMGLSEEDARSSIRVSFSDMNSVEEAIAAADATARAVMRFS